MAGAALLYFLSIVSGTLLTYFFDRGRDNFLARLAMGTAVGLALLASLGFLTALLWGLTTASLMLAAVLMACSFAVLTKADVRATIRLEFQTAFEKSRKFLVHRPTSGNVFVILFSVGLAVFLLEIFSRVLIEDAGGFSTGFINNLGDLPFHLSAISSFAQGNNFPPEDPVFAGAPFTYPFLSDFLSAILVR